jgi:ketosteroid isomerase-like protein
MEVVPTGRLVVGARHVNVVEQLFVLSNRCADGDTDALAELASAYHDDASIESWLAGGPSAERGAAAIREYFDIVSSYREWQCVLDYVQDYDGDRVLALGALRAVQANGVDQEHAVGWIFTFRGDKVASVNAYASYGDALRAATARPPWAHVNTP